MTTPTLIRWCVTCDLPDHLWDATDPLHRDGASQCPGCTRADQEEQGQ